MDTVEPRDNSVRPRILTFIDYYLPGYKAGGPLRSLSNIVEHLSNNFEFLIITRDRDYGDLHPYDSVHIGRWTRHGKAMAYYLPQESWSIGEIFKIMRDTEYEILYLNSFFSPIMSLLPLSIYYARQCRCTTIILAPRGEMSIEALNIKSIRKTIYTHIFMISGIARRVIWQASSENEAHDIRRVLGQEAEKIFIAPDLLPPLTAARSCTAPRRRKPGIFRILFLSRLSRMKNLDFLLRVMTEIKSKICLSIYGPKVDDEYWKICSDLIEKMPVNVMITINGEVKNEDVAEIFSNHDLFVLPTLGENFGHVIFESLSACTPVLISDRTPWKADDKGALEVVPLEISRWRDTIMKWLSYEECHLFDLRQAASVLSMTFYNDNTSVKLNRQLFDQSRHQDM
jgi:glycosyltransferase involved in cell wall biosynthesis